MNTTTTNTTTAPNRMPEPPAVLAALTGAARRSAEAAHAAATTWFSQLQALESALLAAVTLKEGERVDATRLAGAWDAWDAVRAHKSTLSPYWDSYAVNAIQAAKLQGDKPRLTYYSYTTIEEGINAASTDYHNALTRAGVPMPEGDIRHASYWRDAAARGC